MFCNNTIRQYILNKPLFLSRLRLYKAYNLVIKLLTIQWKATIIMPKNLYITY